MEILIFVIFICNIINLVILISILSSIDDFNSNILDLSRSFSLFRKHSIRLNRSLKNEKK